MSTAKTTAHPAFNWGIFLGLLSVAIQATGQAIAPDHPAIGAAISGGAQVLGTVDQALLAAEQEQEQAAAPEEQ